MSVAILQKQHSDALQTDESWHISLDFINARGAALPSSAHHHEGPRPDRAILRGHPEPLRAASPHQSHAERGVARRGAEHRYRRTIIKQFRRGIASSERSVPHRILPVGRPRAVLTGEGVGGGGGG